MNPRTDEDADETAEDTVALLLDSVIEEVENERDELDDDTGGSTVDGAEEEETTVLPETEEKDDARDDAEDGSTMEGGEEADDVPVNVSPVPRWHSVYLL